MVHAQVVSHLVSQRRSHGDGSVVVILTHNQNTTSVRDLVHLPYILGSFEAAQQ